MPNSSVSYEFLKNYFTYIKSQLDKIFQSITVSDVTVIPALSSALSGLETSVISIGPQFNFFGTGHINHSQTLSNGTTYYLLTQNVAGQEQQFPPLSYYLGDPTVATMWITSGSNVYSLPLYFDQTGIYFRPSTQITGISNGATFSFTMLLILAPAAS